MALKITTMKKVFIAIATCALLSSCCTIPTSIAATGNTVGKRCGETSSYIYLGAYGAGGKDAGIQQSAQKAGIKKISHVDMYDKAYFFGLVKKRTIKVYGE